MCLELLWVRHTMVLIANVWIGHYLNHKMIIAIRLNMSVHVSRRCLYQFISVEMVWFGLTSPATRGYCACMCSICTKQSNRYFIGVRVHTATPQIPGKVETTHQRNSYRSNTIGWIHSAGHARGFPRQQAASCNFGFYTRAVVRVHEQMFPYTFHSISISTDCSWIVLTFKPCQCPTLYII